MVRLDPAHPADASFRDAVSAALTAFLDHQEATFEAIDRSLAPVVARARSFTSGGKRLRPAFCAWGWAATASTTEVPDAVLRAAASLELLHVSALVHDDVMDASDTRRGVPAAHRQFEADHVAAGWRGDPAAFGVAGAILLGDLLLMWSDEMFATAGLEAPVAERARPELAAVRTEVTAGQYLDVVAQAQDPHAIARTPGGTDRLRDLTRTVVTWKSASYTVRRPLLLGAGLAGASPEQAAALSSFATPLGRAFQYRDDVLGVFGDEGLTGKQSGEDLREGKLTLLVAEAFAGASPADADRLAGLLGRGDLSAGEVEQARDLIEASGALARVEAAIDAEYRTALSALQAADLSDEGRAGLQALAEAAVRRSH